MSLVKFQSLPEHQHYDVVVLGGGPAGLATAIKLCDYGLRTLVIERSAFDSFRIGEHLTPYGCALLNDFGLYREVLAGPHLKCYSSFALWGDTLSVNDYCCSPHGGFGLNLCRKSFDRILASTVIARGGEFIINTRAQCTENKSGSWNVRLTNCSSTFELTSQFIVDASGKNSAFIAQQRSKSIPDDKLVAICSRADRATYSPDSSLLIESSCDGWWYSCPVNHFQTAVLFFTDQRTLKSSGESTRRFFHNELIRTKLISQRANGCQWSRFYTCIALSRLSMPVAQSNWIAVGDAALTFDPLSSMGISKALEHALKVAAQLKHLLVNYQSYNTDIQNEFDNYLSYKTEYYNQIGFSSSFWNSRRKQVVKRPR